MVCKATIDETDPNELDYADMIVYRNNDESIIKSCDIEVPANACASVTLGQDNASALGITPSTTDTPSSRPSFSTSKSPSLAPSIASSVSPTNTPSNSPSPTPSFAPYTYPTKDPTKEPTDAPTNSPTKTPTQKPKEYPTRQTIVPSENPSMTCIQVLGQVIYEARSQALFPVDPPSLSLIQECNKIHQMQSW